MGESPYLFVFGRTPILSFKELQSFFPDATLINPEIAGVDGLTEEDAQKLIHVLGGTVKIAKLVSGSASLDGSLAGFFAKKDSLTFGVSLYGPGTLPKSLLSDIKKELESMGVSARYVVAHEGETLSSVTLDKRHAEELIVFQNGKSFGVGKTVAVQQYDVWSARDYGRPRADAKSGMLPMKIARMLVNIAAADPYRADEVRQKTIYDPFCGMGTIVSEAYLCGCRVYGSDISAGVVDKAKENISWVTKHYPNDRGSVVKLFTADAVHAADHMAPQSIHAIVTEPFMGSTEIAVHGPVDVHKAQNQIKGLEKLYIGCFKNWHKILAEKGKIIIALPSYAIQGRVLTVKKAVDMCEILGYTIVDGPIEYGRPQAVVKRNFYILQKK